MRNGLPPKKEGTISGMVLSKNRKRISRPGQCRHSGMGYKAPLDIVQEGLRVSAILAISKGEGLSSEFPNRKPLGGDPRGPIFPAPTSTVCGLP